MAARPRDLDAFKRHVDRYLEHFESRAREALAHPRVRPATAEIARGVLDMVSGARKALRAGGVNAYRAAGCIMGATTAAVRLKERHDMRSIAPAGAKATKKTRRIKRPSIVEAFHALEAEHPKWSPTRLARELDRRGSPVRWRQILRIVEDTEDSVSLTTGK
jgi:hypothetical protein